MLKGWTRRTMLRDAWTNDGGKGWWRWWSRLGGLLAMAAAISCLVAPFPGASANPEAKRLYDDLLSNYNRLIRPVGNNSDRLTVKMGLRLSQLIDVVSRPHLTHYPIACICMWIALLYIEGLRPRDECQICRARVLDCEIVQCVSSIGSSQRETISGCIVSLTKSVKHQVLPVVMGFKYE